MEPSNDSFLQRSSELRERLNFWTVPFLVCAAIAHFPLLWRLGGWLWNRDHYSFFPLALVSVAGLLLYAVTMHQPGGPPSAIVRRVIMGLGIFLLVASVLLVSPWLCGVSAMFVLLAVLFSLGGFRLVRSALPAWLLLWLIVPVPLSYDQEAILGMQQLATRLSSDMLDLIGYNHVVDGVIIRLEQNVYEVEEACSGIQSLFSMLFCVGLYCAVTRSHPIRTIASLLFSVYWVLVANVIRIVSVVVLRERWGLPFHEGFLHQLLGVIVFAFTLAMVFSFDRLLNFFIPPI